MPKMKGLYNTIMKTTNKINNRTAFEDKLMEKLFDPNIMSSILNQNHTNTFHNRKNNTDISLIDRTINSYQHARDASIFDVEDDEKQEIIENEIMDRIERIASWLRSNTRNRLTLNSTQDKIIGHGISNQNNTIKELNTQDLTIILEKDDNNLAGFKCVTTYPNISKYSKTATPTGRNLLPDLIQTRTFKQNAEDQPIWTLYGHRSAVTGMNQRTKHPIQAYQTRALQNETKYYFRFNIKICYDRAYIYIYRKI